MFGYNFALYPSTFFGGGYGIYADAPDSAQEFAVLVDECGTREVPPMGLIASMEPAEDDTYEIKVRVKDSWEAVSEWSPPAILMIGPECCQVRGDVNDSGGDPDISDLVYLVDFMFTGGPEPLCLKQGDINASGAIDISDLVYLVDYMFIGWTPWQVVEKVIF